MKFKSRRQAEAESDLAAGIVFVLLPIAVAAVLMIPPAQLGPIRPVAEVIQTNLYGQVIPDQRPFAR